MKIGRISPRAAGCLLSKISTRWR